MLVKTTCDDVSSIISTVLVLFSIFKSLFHVRMYSLDLIILYVYCQLICMYFIYQLYIYQLKPLYLLFSLKLHYSLFSLKPLYFLYSLNYLQSLYFLYSHVNTPCTPGWCILESPMLNLKNGP